MKKDCCDIKVTEINDGYRIEITGQEVKGKCKSIMETCCSDGASWKELFKSCCPAH